MPSFAGGGRFLFCLLLPLFMTPAMAGDALLPDEVRGLLKKHRIFQKQAGIVVWRLGEDAPIIAHQAAAKFNPASVIKIATAFAALDLLGADFRWKTQIAYDGVIQDDVLRGDLYFVGGGDPLITAERFLHMLDDLRGRGIRRIEGDVVMDGGLFALPPHDSSAFDGALLKPYNVGAGALMVGWKSARAVFSTLREDRVEVYLQPPNDNVAVNNQVRYGRGKCRNWRRGVREKWTRRAGKPMLALSGKYPRRCGEQGFFFSPDLSHEEYVGGVFSAWWRRLGGEWQGRTQIDSAPETAIVIAEYESPPLSDVVKAMNKFSNNVIARNLFLSLPFSRPGAAHTVPSARRIMRDWLLRQGLAADGVWVDNGSGLSRQVRITPMNLARLLQKQWRHPARAELLSSLPILGIDGTVKKRLRRHPSAGRGRFKTGSLDGVKTLAGVMKDKAGRDVLLVALINGGGRAKNFQDALLQWVYDAR